MWVDFEAVESQETAESAIRAVGCPGHAIALNNVFIAALTGFSVKINCDTDHLFFLLVMEGGPVYNGVALVGGASGVLLASVAVASGGRGVLFALVTSGAGCGA